MRELSVLQETICGYQVTEVLGGDAVSELLAVQAPTTLGSYVSLRRLSVAATRHPAVVSYFVGEYAELTEQLHRTLGKRPRAALTAAILGRGRDASGRPYLLMSHAGGMPLTVWLTRHATCWPEADVMRSGLALAEALADAHELKIIHGGLCPSAIQLPPWEALVEGAPPLLLNFGLRRLSHWYEQASGHSLPPPPAQRRYLAPELKEGAALTSAVDVYALGVVLHELLHRSPESPAWRTSRPSDSPLERLLQSMLTPTSTQRPPMSDVASQLARLLDNQPAFEIEQLLSAPEGELLGVAKCRQTVRRGILHRVVGGPQHIAAAESMLLGAQRLQGTSCAGFVRVISYGRWPDHGAYVFMEPLFHETLATYLHRVAPPRTEVLGIIAQLAQAAAALHETGSFHLGIRPERVAVLAETPVRVLLLAGEAPSVSSDATRRSSETLRIAHISQQLYLAPELTRGELGGGPADVYALGALMQCLLYSPRVAPPEAAPAGQSTVASTGSQLTRRPDTPTVSRELQELLRAMLASAPEQRPTMAEVARMLPWLGLVFQLLNGPPLAGKYTIVRQLSSGGMGAIFEAVNVLSNGRVALKIPFPQFSHERIRQEVRAAIRANSQHPGIVRIFDCEQFANGTPYIVMEFLEGELLSERIARCGQSLPVAAVARLGHQIASALAAAHSVGVIHRDLKPDNVMIVRDQVMPGGERVKVFDFGIAKLVSDYQYQESQRLTSYGMFMGTLYYSAPEQRTDAAGVSEQADVYSLGAMLYEMLGGPLPIQLPLRPLGPQWVMTLITSMTADKAAQRPTMTIVEQVLQQRLQVKATPRYVPVLAVLLGAIAVLASALAIIWSPRAAHEKKAPAQAQVRLAASAARPGVPGAFAARPPAAATHPADLGSTMDVTPPVAPGPPAAPGTPAPHLLAHGRKPCSASQLQQTGVSRFSVVYDGITEAITRSDTHLLSGDQLVLNLGLRGIAVRSSRGLDPKQRKRFEASLHEVLGSTPLKPGVVVIECKRH